MDAQLFQGTVEKYMKIRHIRTKEQLRAHTTCGSNKTFGKYMNNPELMPIGIYEEIMKALNVPKDEKQAIL